MFYINKSPKLILLKIIYLTNLAEFEYTGKPTFQGLLNAERKGEAFYNQYPDFIESLDPKNIKNIISNVTRNLVTSYFKLKGLLSNTQHAKHIDFHDIFNLNFTNSKAFQNYGNNIKSFDAHINISKQELDSKTTYENSTLGKLHDHKMHKHHFENFNFNETIRSFLTDEVSSIKRISKFLTENFNTFIPSEEEMFYFGQLKNKKCAKAIMKKFFDSFLFQHILDFLGKIKDKYGETLKKFYDYLENAENEIYENEKGNLKRYNSHEYLKLFVISDFIVSSYLSNMNLTDDEKKAFEDLKAYYNLVIRSINFSSDVVELFSSKVFEEILKEIVIYKNLLINRNEENTEKYKNRFQNIFKNINNQDKNMNEEIEKGKLLIYYILM